MCLLPGFPCGLFVVSAWWTVPFLLALVWGSRFPVLLFILLGPDLSLFRPFLLQPLAPGAFLVGACVCLGYLRSLVCPSPSPGGIPIGIPSFLYGYLLVALSLLPGSLLCLLPGYRSSSSQFPVFWLVICFLPCGPAPGLSLWPVGCSPVSSVRARSCVLSWTLGFSIPLLITSSWAPLSRFSSSTASSSVVLAVASGFCLSAPLVCFILLSLTTCLLFLFLGTAFPSAQ